MLALVTGATGFIGSHLVDELLNQGYDVRVLVRPTSNLKWLPESRIEVVTGQMHNPEDIDRATEGVDYIFHVAGTLVADDMEGFRRVNVLPTKLMLEAALKLPNFKRFLLVSSQGAAGPSPDGKPLKESSTPNPISDYGRTKLEGEDLAMTYADRLPVTACRPSAVYGPRDANFLKFFRYVNSGFRPKFGTTDRYTNLVHAVDLAKGLIMAAEHENTKGEVYFISNPRIYSYDEFARTISGAIGKKCRVITIPNRVFDLMSLYARISKRFGNSSLLDEQRIETLRSPYWIADVSKLKDHTGWTAPTRLEDGIQETTAWYRQKGWLQ